MPSPVNESAARNATGVAIGSGRPGRAARPEARDEGRSRSSSRPARRSTAHRACEADGRASDLAGELRALIGEHRFQMWFAETATIEADDTGLRVRATSPFVADWIRGHFDGALRELAQRRLGPGATVEVEFDATCRASSPSEAGGSATDEVADDGPRQPAEAGRTDLAAQRRGRWSPGAERRLEDFVVGECNRLAHDAAVRLAEATDGHTGSLFVHGSCGLGKTHLLKGICQRRKSRFPGQRIRYTTGEQFTNEYIAAVRGGRIDAFRERVRRLDLLAIDDVHFLSNKTATQSEFLHTIDSIGLGGARIVLASDEHPRQIRSFSQGLVSRFLSGIVVRIDRPDRAMRLELIRRVAAARGVRLAPAAEEAVATHVAASAREIEGAITKLAALRQLAGGEGEIGMVLVQQLLDDQGPRSTGPVRFASILERVCSRMGVERGELLGSGRHRRVVLARGVVAYLARELTTMSFPEIARGLGRGNHSSVHTADQRVRRQMTAAETVDGLPDSGPVTVTELVDQLRHAIRTAPA